MQRERHVVRAGLGNRLIGTLERELLSTWSQHTAAIFDVPNSVPNGGASS
jgi:hypothetical protein